MPTTIAFLFFGLIVGSFLNVLTLRFAERPLTGRSACPSCGRRLEWYELIPVVSWLLLLGRCRTCRAPISLQYPLVELGTGIVFALIGASPLPLSAILLALPIASLLIAISVYDLRTTFIPDAWVYTLAALSLLSQFLFPPFAILYTPYFFLAGPLVALPLFGFWLFSRGTWMGFGDVKLALAIGWLMGVADGMAVLFLAFISGGAIGAFLLLFSSSLWQRLRKNFTPSSQSQRLALAYTMKSEVPFGPFLVAATLIVWISHMHGISLGFETILALL